VRLLPEFRVPTGRQGSGITEMDRAERGTAMGVRSFEPVEACEDALHMTRPAEDGEVGRPAPEGSGADFEAAFLQHATHEIDAWRSTTVGVDESSFGVEREGVELCHENAKGLQLTEVRFVEVEGTEAHPRDRRSDVGRPLDVVPEHLLEIRATAFVDEERALGADAGRYRVHLPGSVSEALGCTG